MRIRKIYVFKLTGYEVSRFPRKFDQTKQGYKNIFTSNFYSCRETNKNFWEELESLFLFCQGLYYHKTITITLFMCCEKQDRVLVWNLSIITSKVRIFTTFKLLIYKQYLCIIYKLFILWLFTKFHKSRCFILRTKTCARPPYIEKCALISLS